jgi:predicted Rossmann fold flavoprotein
MNTKKKIIVVGGGAAGFFGAISAATHHPEAEVLILEKNNSVLNKVRISGGGRCNVTHACFNNKKLTTHYPRGEKFLQPLFEQFSTKDTIQWFENRDVILKTEADGRMFPTTDSSSTVIYALQNEVRRLGITVHTSTGVQKINPKPNGFDLDLFDTPQNKLGERVFADYLIITTGGVPTLDGYQWLIDLGLNIVPPVPSLFTFNVPNSPLSSLMGTSVPHAQVRIVGTKHRSEGPLLITHWGFSGPAILKLSSWVARDLAECDYQFDILVNWTGTETETTLREQLTTFRTQNPKKQVWSHTMFGLPSRLWEMLCAMSEVQDSTRWMEISQKSVNKLVENLLNYVAKVSGKTTFKEEFVTAGGIDLSEIDQKTLQSKKHPNLFFAGEVLDIDAVTGGFNFQAAWTTSFLAGRLGT